jgi:hypothetical protein
MEGKPALRAIQSPRPLEPEPPDERTVEERAKDEWQERAAQVEEAAEQRLASEASTVRAWLVSAFGGEPDDWEWISGESPDQGRTLTEWRPAGSSAWRLAVLADGVGPRAQRVVLVAAKCEVEGHPPYAISENVGPSPASLGEVVAQPELWPPCPACQQDALNPEDRQANEFEIIGRALVTAVSVTVRAKIEADLQGQQP